MEKRNLKIGIIGAGISGMCMAIQLQKQLGIHDYVIFEENNEVGGVWLVNTYPGCACDVPSHLFSFSFEPNPNWSESFSSQPEILEYLKSVARKHDLYKKIKFQTRVKSATWDEKISKWKVVAQNQEGIEEEYIFDIGITCVGGLRVPFLPEEFNGFQGPKIHTARWDHSIKLDNKKVAIVGTGASAVQIIPQIVEKVKKLTVYQRNPPWVVPRLQFSFPSWVQWAFATVPGVQKSFRSTIFWLYEMSHNIYMKGSTLGRLGEKLGKSYVKKEFKKDDHQLRKELVPKYSIGCKRITPSDEYYNALSQPNCNVITTKIKEVKPHSIVTEDGHEENIDVLILATGFRVQDFFLPLKVTGKDSLDLLKVWKTEGPSTYLGACTSNLPNSFFVIGPNAAPGNTSIIFTVECQTNWIVQVLKEMMERGSSTVVVDAEVEKRHMARIQRDLDQTIWSTCSNYYTNEKGMVTALNPDTAFSYWWQTRRPNFDHFIFE